MTILEYRSLGSCSCGPWVRYLCQDSDGYWVSELLDPMIHASPGDDLKESDREHVRMFGERFRSLAEAEVDYRSGEEW